MTFRILAPLAFIWDYLGCRSVQILRIFRKEWLHSHLLWPWLTSNRCCFLDGIFHRITWSCQLCAFFSTKNSFGTKVLACFSLLLLQEVPEIPGNFDLVGHSSRQANLSWSLPYDGQSPLLAFHLEFQRTDAGKKKFHKYLYQKASFFHTLPWPLQYDIWSFLLSLHPPFW